MNTFLSSIPKLILLLGISNLFFIVKAENNLDKKALDFQTEMLTKKVNLPADKETCEKVALCAAVSGNKLEQPCAELLGKFLNSSRSGQDEYLNKCETILKEAELDKNKDN